VSDSPHFLKKLELSGFRSIRNARISFSSDLNVLIGANGSGKSNIISFFRMLGQMMDSNKGLQNYVAENGRADGLLFRGTETTQNLSAELSFNLNRYSFALQAAQDGTLFFSSEEVFFKGPHFGSTTYTQGSGHLESKLSVEQGLRSAEQWAREAVRGWRVYHFHNTSPSAPMMGDWNVVDNECLLENAGNIAAVLFRIWNENRPYYDRIVAHIRQAAPYFGDFVFKKMPVHKIMLCWKERYSDKMYYPAQLSDGSIRFICLATLLLQPDPPQTIIIDEPELGLHPSAVHVLIGMLALASEKSQIIACTQSSQLVNGLDVDDLIVVDRKNGETTFSRPDEDALAHWLDEYSLGELWEKDILGGRPQP